jgi:uncharacterized protein (DUF433 family)
MATAGRKSATRTARKIRIVTTQGICGGQPRIAGTRIPISVLIRCRALGFSDARVMEGYPALTKANLAAAWAYADKHGLRS